MKSREVRVTGLFLSVVMLASLMCSACRHNGDEFPDIEYPESSSVTESVETSDDDGNKGDEVISLTVATPYNDSTIEYLAKLYYCKLHDLCGENTGATIGLDYLDGIDTNFIIHTVLTSDEGASVDNIRSWEEDGLIPDVFLTGQVDKMASEGMAEPLNGYDSVSSAVVPGRVFLSSASVNITNGTLYGIPYYSTVMLLAGNSDYIPSSGKLPFKSTVTRFREYLAEIKEEYDVVPLSSGYDMVPYINSAFAGDMALSFMVYKEYKSDPNSALNIITNTINFVNGLYEDGLTANYAVNGANPVFSRRSGLWTISSTEIDSWDQYYPGELYLVAFPQNDENSPVVPMTTLYSLCVNKSAANKDFAADFAAFMALDNDARMLIERLEPKTGFLPSVRSLDVWALVTSDELFGPAAQFYYQTLDNAVYCPHMGEPVYVNVNDYLSNYNGAGFDAEACYGQD